MWGPLVSVRPGQWVTSTAGRDKGTHYLVAKVENEKFVRVVDGRKRPIDQSKRKSLRHLWVHDVVHQEVASRLAVGRGVADSQVRQALEEIVGKEEEVG